PSVDNQHAEVIAPIAEVIPQVADESTGSPSSTAVDQDTPSPSKSLTPMEIQSQTLLLDNIHQRHLPKPICNPITL
nr:hypothetical protein [Tanacetum cinerariifolium]